MESLMGNNDDFVNSQLRFEEDTSQLGPLGSADDGEMMMTLSRAAESADKAEKRRKKADKKRKRALEQVLMGAAAATEDGSVIDPELLGMQIDLVDGGNGGEASGSGMGGGGGDGEGGEDEEDPAAQDEASPPTKKSKGKRARKVKAPPAPGYQEIIGPFPSEDGEGPAPQSMLDDSGNPLHPPPVVGSFRKKHAVTPEELRSQFTQPGAMQSYLSERWMTTKELKRLEEAGILTYKKGTFTKAEEDAIRRSVSYFQQANHLSDDGVSEALMAKKNKNSPYQGLWSEIASAVPGRPVRFVQKYVKRLYDTRARKGKWTEKEDEDLLRVYATSGGSWVMVAQTVDRSEEDCRARWRDCLRTRTDRDEGRWTKAEEAQLLTAIKEANAASGKDEMARDPPWEVVTLKMDGKRTSMQCRKKWQARMWPDLVGLADEDLPPLDEADVGAESDNGPEAGSSTPKKSYNARMSVTEKHKLVKVLLDLAPGDTSEIDWTTISSIHFPRVTAGALAKVFKNMVIKTGSELSAPLPDILAELQKTLPADTRRANPVYKSSKVVPAVED